MCANYIDLNKAMLKDNFSMPQIDQLVDTTSRHEMLSFVDAYFGYNQISMHRLDEDKNTFITVDV